MRDPGIHPALNQIDVATMRGIEIGPLYRPYIRKDQGEVYYVDHCSTDELRQVYQYNSDVRAHLDEIVAVDYVVGPGMSLGRATKEQAPFDYLIAAHVIEHVANPIGWLADSAAVLVDGGVVSLVIPDKRFCFDTNRRLTQLQDWADWYLRELAQPDYVHLFDFYSNAVTVDGAVDTAGIWAGTVDYSGCRRTDVPDADVAAYEACLDLRNSGRYMDVHTGAYTPRSFLELLDGVARLGLLALEVAYLQPTAEGELEFFVSLRKVGTGNIEHTRESIRRALGICATAPAPRPGSPGQGAPGQGAQDQPVATGPEPEPKDPLSPKELALIMAKRKLLFAARSQWAMLRRRAR